MLDKSHLNAMNPAIEAAYERHMGKNGFEPIDPIALMQRATRATNPDALEYGQIARESFEAHAESLESLGLDFRGVLSASYFVNMLTEVNLPHYTDTIGRVADESEPLRTWLNEWTAEEQPHEVVLRDYAILSGLMGSGDSMIPHNLYAQGVTSQLRSGTEITVKDLARGFAYLSLQEDATFLAHKAEASLLDSVGRQVQQTVAGNEFKHHRVYAELTNAMLDHFPDESVQAIRDVYGNFVMPGKKGIPGFDRKALVIARAGLFGPKDIAEMQRKHAHGIYGLERREFTSDDARQAQTELLQGFEGIKTLVTKMETLQDRAIARAKMKGDPTPFILGKTVEVTDKVLRIIH